MMVGRAWSLTSRWWTLVCVAVAAASCGPAEQEETETGVEESPSERRPTTEMAGGDQRFAQHMQRISGVPPDSLVHVMPMHLEEVGVILDELEPMTMGMQSDTVWRSTVDSVQNDLARMRDMGADELREFMPGHTRRMERLIFLHDSAMGSER